MKLFLIAAIAVGTLGFAPARAQQRFSPGRNQYGQTATQNSWMMDYEQMMGDMKTADLRLQSLAARMASAKGDDRVPAIQDVVSEVVQDQLAMHRHMMMMHDHMMSQMPMK